MTVCYSYYSYCEKGILYFFSFFLPNNIKEYHVLYIFHAEAIAFKQKREKKKERFNYVNHRKYLFKK